MTTGHKNRMQAKDIDTFELLSSIERVQRQLQEESNLSYRPWCFVWNLEEPFASIPDKVFRAKTQKLINQGLLYGCACGCRGDYEVTKQGLEFIAARHQNGVSA